MNLQPFLTFEGVPVSLLSSRGEDTEVEILSENLPQLVSQHRHSDYQRPIWNTIGSRHGVAGNQPPYCSIQLSLRYLTLDRSNSGPILAVRLEDFPRRRACLALFLDTPVQVSSVI